MAFEFKLPDIGEGVVEGEIVKWLICKGERIDEDQPMVEIMTDKATVEIPAPVAGEVLETNGQEGSVVEVGATLVVIESDSAPESSPEVAATPSVSAPPKPRLPKATDKRILATPATRRLARQKGVDLTTVVGTGRGGRVTNQDVLRAAEGIATGPPPPSEQVESIPYRGLRRKIGDHLLAAKRFAPHYTYCDEMDATSMVESRRRFNERHPAEQIAYLPFVAKALISGLREFPFLNATLDEEKQVIHLKKSYNIGIATATAEGLMVPVVKQADRLSLLELGQAIGELAERTSQGKANLDDLRDGTFTITSLGALGGIFATPIINYPEVAILGVHRIGPRAVVREDQIVIRQMMNLSLSADHRVIDGAVAARFMNKLISLLEDPAWLALQ